VCQDADLVLLALEGLQGCKLPADASVILRQRVLMSMHRMCVDML
jgi:hypothetical protein